MNKQKTGEMIKQARLEKEYTQTQLEFGVALIIARFLRKEKHQPDPA